MASLWPGCRQCLQYMCLFSLAINPTHATPFDLLTPASHLLARDFVINNATGTPEVFDPDSQALIPQGPATDGGGYGLNAPAVIWLIFSLAVGVPLALAGYRGRKITTGIGVGLVFAVCSWAAFINSLNASGVSDILLTVIILIFSLFGFLIGVWDFARVAGITLVSIAGGVAVGVRVMIIRERLLLQPQGLFPVVWVLIGVCGLIGGALVLRWQRAGILFGCASSGTFLAFLGVDLIINQQEGMSRGLRYLFDRNSAHAADIIVNGYTPPLSSQILLGVSLGLTPLLAYAQHRVFKAPFHSQSYLDTEAEEALNPATESPLGRAEKGFFTSRNRLKSRFSL